MCLKNLDKELNTTICKRNAGEVLIMNETVFNKRQFNFKVKCNKSCTTLTSGRCSPFNKTIEQ
jgi:hypothetical protein